MADLASSCLRRSFSACRVRDAFSSPDTFSSRSRTRLSLRSRNARWLVRRASQLLLPNRCQRAKQHTQPDSAPFGGSSAGIPHPSPRCCSGPESALMQAVHRSRRRRESGPRCCSRGHCWRSSAGANVAGERTTPDRIVGRDRSCCCSYSGSNVRTTAQLSPFGGALPESRIPYPPGRRCAGSGCDQALGGCVTRTATRAEDENWYSTSNPSGWEESTVNSPNWAWEQ